MGKDKSKKKHDGTKKGKAPEAEAFPDTAPAGADEKASAALDTDTLTKKEKKAIHGLQVLPSGHAFPRGVEQIERVKYLNGILADEGAKKKAREAAKVELQAYRKRGEVLMFERNREEQEAKADAKVEKKAKATAEAPTKIVTPEVDEEVAAIKARVQARQKERYEAMIADGATEEAARQMSRFTAIRDEDPKGRTLGKVGAKIMSASIPTAETEDAAELARLEPDVTEPPMTEPLVPLSTPKKAKGKGKGKKAAEEPETASQPVHEAEEVSTETGREFAVGPVADDEDLDPHAADRDADGVRWSKHASPRPYIVKPDGKEAIYSRMTSYIDVLDEKSGLQDWKDRTLLVGVARAAAELDPDLTPVNIVAAVNDLVAETEAALAKAEKRLAKGKTTVAEHAAEVEAAEKAYKSAARALVEDMRDRGGAHDAAQKGTDLHKVFEDFDNAKMADKSLTVDGWLDQGIGEPGSNYRHRRDDLSPADIADLRAYAAAVEASGIEVLACERRVVLDEYGVTGTLDRSIMATPPGAARRVKMVGDVKTGRLDYGAGKFAAQVYGYAMGQGYANSTEREDLKHSKKWGVIFHSPAGKAKTTVYFIDLSKGVEGWKAIETVRDWRRTTTEAQTFRGQKPYMFESVSAEVSEDGGIVIERPDVA